jgi:RND family efflux transporter MFP subunit
MSEHTDEHQYPKTSTLSSIQLADEEISLIPLSQIDADSDELNIDADEEDSDDPDLDDTDEAAPQPAKKSILLIKTVAICAVLGAVIGGISIAVKQFKPPSSMAGMEGMPMEDMMRVDGAANPTPVKVESIKPSAIESSVRYTGTVRPYKEVTVYPRVGGQLNEYSVYPGDRVQAGQVLARIGAAEISDDVDEARKALDAAKADEQASRRELEEQYQEIRQLTTVSNYLTTKAQRTEQVLLQPGAISRNELDRQKNEATAALSATRTTQIKSTRMQAQIAKATAQVAQAQVKIKRLKAIEGYKIITSPITGVVQERMADPGVAIQTSMGMLKIGNYSKVRLQANVAQQNLTGVTIGSPIVARSIGNKSKPINGRVTSIFPKAGEETRTVIVEAIIDNPGAQILGGQAVEMQIITAHRSNALSVPQAALTESAGKQAVWLLVGKSAHRKFVTTGLTNGDRVEILSGLQPGALVITSGQEKLIENSLVAAIDDLGKPVASLSNDASPTVQGNTQIKLISPQGKAGSGDNQLVLEVQDAKTGKPMQVAGLQVSVVMAMKNSTPMSAEVEVKPDAQMGRFKVKTYLGMGGKWEVTAKVRDPSHTGNNSFTLDNH